VDLVGHLFHQDGLRGEIAIRQITAVGNVRWADGCAPSLPLAVGQLEPHPQALDRGQPDRAHYRLMAAIFAGGWPGDMRRQIGDGLIQEEILGGVAQPLLARTRHGLNAEDGVAAELEEVVMDTNLVETEDVGPDGGEPALGIGARWGVADRGRRSGWRGRRQGLPVQLAARGDRKLAEGDEGGRDHIVGQSGGQVSAQLPRAGGLVPRGHHVGHQPPGAGLVLPRRDHGLSDRGMAQQGRLHLAGFDPEPADLDLLISAAQVFHHAGTGPAGQVAGTVYPPARRPERAGQEPRRGQPLTVQVTPRQLRPGHVQLTGHPRRHRLQPAIKDVSPHIRQRPADHRPGPRHPARQRINRALRRPSCAPGTRCRSASRDNALMDKNGAGDPLRRAVTEASFKTPMVVYDLWGRRCLSGT